MLARISLVAMLAACSAQSAASAEPQAAAIGKPAPDFTLQDTDGKQVKLSALRGKTVVLEWFNPDCPFVKHARGKGPLQGFPQRVASPSLVWLSINSGAANKQGAGLDRNRAAKQEYGMQNQVLLDEAGKVGRAYGAQKTPHLYVIDPKGILVYRGGLDNAPVGVVDDARPKLPGTAAGALEPYLDNALADLGQAKAIRMSDTPPYGCSVKYAD